MHRDEVAPVVPESVERALHEKRVVEHRPPIGGVAAGRDHRRRGKVGQRESTRNPQAPQSSPNEPKLTVTFGWRFTKWFRSLVRLDRPFAAQDAGYPWRRSHRPPSCEPRAAGSVSTGSGATPRQRCGSGVPGGARRNGERLVSTRWAPSPTRAARGRRAWEAGSSLPSRGRRARTSSPAKRWPRRAGGLQRYL